MVVRPQRAGSLANAAGGRCCLLSAAAHHRQADLFLQSFTRRLLGTGTVLQPGWHASSDWRPGTDMGCNAFGGAVHNDVCSCDRGCRQPAPTLAGQFGCLSGQHTAKVCGDRCAHVYGSVNARVDRSVAVREFGHAFHALHCRARASGCLCFRDLCAIRCALLRDSTSCWTCLAISVVHRGPLVACSRRFRHLFRLAHLRWLAARQGKARQCWIQPATG